MPRITGTPLLTAIAMLAFAANSLLCRLALGDQQIDAASFTTVRVVAGAVTLSLFMLLVRRNGTPRARAGFDWRAAGMLFAYMIFFSFAYLSLSAGTGALLLFGSVQLTMIIAALRAGEHFTPWSWAGLAAAVAGLVYLVSPGITAPDPVGAVFMVVAGLAWGFYSLVGRRAGKPLEATANNFLLAAPMAIAASLLFISDLQLSTRGLLLAIASGSVASGLGYVTWYAALKGLSSTRAATVQLSVPVIAAIGGVLMLAEPVTLRLVLASAATLGGIAIVLLQRASARP
jgi:drug/metabolite transporter (DMT)-like permease